MSTPTLTVSDTIGRQPEVARLLREAARGFNTWFNHSVLTHALTAEGAAVSLGFKFYNSGRVLREALIGRFGEHDETVRPGPRSFDGRYTELVVECSEHAIKVQSAADGDTLRLLVTPLKSAPAPATLLVSAAVLWNRPGHAELTDSGSLRIVTPEKTFAVEADGQRVRQLNTGLTNPYYALELSRPLAVTVRPVSASGPAPAAADTAALMAERQREVAAAAARYGELADAFDALRACVAWDTIFEPEKEQPCTPVSRLWNISWGGYVLFEWDTYFTAMLAMVADRRLACANAIAITREVTEAGFVPNFGAADDDKSRDRSEPPVGALAVRELFRQYREPWLVAALFDPLLGWNRWFARRRMTASGALGWGSDPFHARKGKLWETEGVNGRLGASLESGLDNSPMYDDIPFDPVTHRLLLEDVGLTGLFIQDCEALADLARVIGRGAAADELTARAAQAKAGLETLWDEASGMYCNRRTDSGEFSRRFSPTNFYALFADNVPPARALRMIREHFMNPAEFFGEHMLPSIARNDPAYPDQEYWRGRIWAPMNYLAYLALRKHAAVASASASARAAREAGALLAEKSVALLLREWRDCGHVHENYSAETGLGCGIRSSDKFYNWGGLLALTGLIEAGHVAGPEEPL